MNGTRWLFLTNSLYRRRKELPSTARTRINTSSTRSTSRERFRRPQVADALTRRDKRPTLTLRVRKQRVDFPSRVFLSRRVTSSRLVALPLRRFSHRDRGRANYRPRACVCARSRVKNGVWVRIPALSVRVQHPPGCGACMRAEHTTKDGHGREKVTERVFFTRARIQEGGAKSSTTAPRDG